MMYSVLTLHRIGINEYRMKLFDILRFLTASKSYRVHYQRFPANPVLIALGDETRRRTVAATAYSLPHISRCRLAPDPTLTKLALQQRNVD